jgi:hypothetical protein
LTNSVSDTDLAPLLGTVVKALQGAAFLADESATCISAGHGRRLTRAMAARAGGEPG